MEVGQMLERCDEIPEVEVPTTLYKYCPPERIDILEGLQIRFSGAAGLALCW
jgi:hypothetical protein